MNETLVKPGPSGKPVVKITASAAASVTAAAKAAMNKALKDNVQINDAVSKVLQGYDWTLVPVAVKYVFHINSFCRLYNSSIYKFVVIRKHGFQFV